MWMVRDEIWAVILYYFSLWAMYEKSSKISFVKEKEKKTQHNKLIAVFDLIVIILLIVSV